MNYENPVPSEESKDYLTEISEQDEFGSSTDYSERFRYIVLPPWVENAISKSNKDRSICTDAAELSSILSRADVENYFRTSENWLISGLIYVGEGFEEVPANYFNNHAIITDRKDRFMNTLSRVKTSNYLDEDRGDRFGYPSFENLMFNYFLDSDKAAVSKDSVYITIRPYFDNIIAIRIHIAGPDENVYQKQSEAYSDWISMARKYVTFESIASSGIIETYLESHKKFLKSTND